jgi:cyanophycinase-like exopeptidase
VETTGSGPIALVGSGEFLPVMEEVDRHLLQGRPGRAVFLPTAAAQEGEERWRYWIDLGMSHFQRLGVVAEPLEVRDRADADRGDLAVRIAGAGLVYLSGGDPGYLATTLRDTAVGRAITDAWHAGAAIAGCSAGAVALTERVPDIRDRSRPAQPGLGLVHDVVVLPHFDQLERWVPGITDFAVGMAPLGNAVIGIDEDTAIVGGPVSWTVWGRQAAWRLLPGGERIRHGAGETLELTAGG